jgi:predicted ATPase with chaperone activity
MAALLMLVGAAHGQVRGQAGASAPAPQSTALEQRFRQRMGAIVRERLALTDAQAQQLGDVSRRFEQERRTLAIRERALRLQLRDELQAGEAANQERVGRALDRMLELQRTRIDLLQREQAELSRFLTPVQRARYVALQEQLRRRIEEARRQQEGGATPARPRRPGLRPGAYVP